MPLCRQFADTKRPLPIDDHSFASDARSYPPLLFTLPRVSLHLGWGVFVRMFMEGEYDVGGNLDNGPGASVIFSAPESGAKANGSRPLRSECPVR